VEVGGEQGGGCLVRVARLLVDCGGERGDLGVDEARTASRMAWCSSERAYIGKSLMT
jgi:hypothetical protein